MIGRVTGFSMLEALIAVGVILFGLLSLVSLGATSLISSQTTNEQFIATNLAREGMEVIRQTRDLNWLNYDAYSTAEWNDGLYYEEAAGVYDFSTVITIHSLFKTKISFIPDTFGESCSGLSGNYDCTSLWLDTTGERYFQTTSSMFDHTDPRYEETQYSRLVYLYPICRDINNPSDEQIISTEGAVDCDGLETVPTEDFEQVGIDAIVQVQWPARSTIATYTIEEYIYDWRY